MEKVKSMCPCLYAFMCSKKRRSLSLLLHEQKAISGAPLLHLENLPKQDLRPFRVSVPQPLKLLINLQKMVPYFPPRDNRTNSNRSNMPNMPNMPPFSCHPKSRDLRGPEAPSFPALYVQSTALPRQAMGVLMQAQWPQHKTMTTWVLFRGGRHFEIRPAHQKSTW